jgi:hypothetical protein
MGFMLQDFPPLLRMIAAISTTAAGGYLNNGLFSWEMAISTFPIFVAGQILPVEDILAKSPRGWRTFLAGLVFMSLILLLEFSKTGFEFMSDMPAYSWGSDRPWYHWSGQQPPCTTKGRWLLWLRGAVFRNALELTKCLIFLLCICPRRPCFMSTLGRYTLYPMLIHEPFMSLPLKWFANEPDAWSMPYPEKSAALLALAWLGQFAFAFTLTLLLSAWPARMIFSVFIEPAWFEKFVDFFRRCEEGLYGYQGRASAARMPRERKLPEEEAGGREGGDTLTTQATRSSSSESSAGSDSTPTGMSAGVAESPPCSLSHSVSPGQGDASEEV